MYYTLSFALEHKLVFCLYVCVCAFVMIVCVCVFPQTKEEVVGTLEAVQALQVQSGQLQKARETHHGRCLELDRLRKENAPQKELEKVCVCHCVSVGLCLL